MTHPLTETLYREASKQMPPVSLNVLDVNGAAVATREFIIIPASNLTGAFRDESRWGTASELDGIVLLYGKPATHDGVFSLQNWFIYQNNRYEITDILIYPSAPLWEARAQVRK